MYMSLCSMAWPQCAFIRKHIHTDAPRLVFLNDRCLISNVNHFSQRCICCCYRRQHLYIIICHLTVCRKLPCSEIIRTSFDMATSWLLAHLLAFSLWARWVAMPTKPRTRALATKASYRDEAPECFHRIVSYACWEAWSMSICLNRSMFHLWH